MQIAKKLSKLSNGNKPLAHLMAVLSDIYLCFGCFTYFSIIEFQIYFPVTTVFKFITNWPSFNCANRNCQKEKKPEDSNNNKLLWLENNLQFWFPFRS